MRARTMLARSGRLATLVAIALGAATPPARGNGAFPDSAQILLPRGKPQQIVLGTNFGLVLSDDDGKSWNWTCEQSTSLGGNLYQLGPAPQERLYALSKYGLVRSDDDSCTWTPAAGTLTEALATDFFPDPSDLTRVWAIAQRLAPGTSPGIYLSTDSGQTFGAPLYEDPLPGGMLGIEVARSEPATVYVAMYQLPTLPAPDAGDADADPDTAAEVLERPPSPLLLRSSDGGAHWEPPIDLEPALGRGTFRIIAVHPTNPRHLFLRFVSFDAPSEVLAISEDGGATFRKAISVAGRLTAFLRRTDDSLLVTGLTEAGPVGYRSTDGGATFVPWPKIPRIRALAERDGRLYAATDFINDGFALGVSVDDGVTFTPVMTFADVKAIRSCVAQACADPCNYQAGIGLWPATTCDPTVTPKPRPKRTGCGCAVDGHPSGTVGLLVVGAALSLLRARRRRGPVTAARWDRPSP